MPRARRRRSHAPSCWLAALGGVALDACASRTTREPTAADYLGELEAICADTAAQLDALPDPPDGITVTDFATQASSILTDEAEQFRGLDVPADLDDDHRALIANDEDQAAGWTDLAAAAVGGSADAERDHDHDHVAQPRPQRPRHRAGRAGCVRSPG